MENWVIQKDHIVYRYNGDYINLTVNTPIAGFDMDCTIITSKSGKKFPINQDDWMFYNNSVIDKLQRYSSEYQLVIITNQKILSKKPKQIDGWKKKIKSICKQIDRPILLLASLKDDVYRKPFTGLWDKYIICDKERSFYCGDAGGLGARVINKDKINKDFSDSDIKFAYNVGVRFIHRDEFIYNVSHKNNISYDVNLSNIKKGRYVFKPFSSKQELIIMVGYPGSGKSYYVENYILQHNYKYISRDVLKTKSKVIKVLKESIIAGQSVVLDNTNPSKDIRKEYIQIAKDNNVKCRCIVFNTSFNHSYHNNMYRMVKTGKKVPIIAYRIYKKKYEDPKLNEGFYKIDKIDFKLDPSFNDKIYYKYYF